jgi:hypothetical protein
MRKRYIHNTSAEEQQQYRIRNRFSYSRDVPIQETIPSITASSRDCHQNNIPSEDNDHDMESHEHGDMESQYNYDVHNDMESQYNYEHDDLESQYNYGHDDLESQYNYGYDDTDFDSSYEESVHFQDNRHENEEEEEEERQQIVDKALNEDKMPSFSNYSELAPYFENLTAASLFCWLQKHNISTSAYEDLADILHNTNFNPAHVVKNVRRFRTWRERLPLLPISARLISISSKKTPSTSKSSKFAYQLSVRDIIYHVLNNPSMVKHMYFGPGVDSETKTEYWHGTLWGESPLFGEDQITILGGM